MAAALQPAARKCTRCGHSIAQRGDQPPLYCAICGQELIKYQVTPEVVPGAGPDETQHFRSATRAAGAFTTILAGFMSMLPGIGVLFAFVAIVLSIGLLKSNAHSQNKHFWWFVAAFSIMSALFGGLLNARFVFRYF